MGACVQILCECTSTYVRTYVYANHLKFRTIMFPVWTHYCDPCLDTLQCSLFGHTTVFPVWTHYSVPCLDTLQCSLFGHTTVFPVWTHYSVPCLDTLQCSLFGHTTVFPVWTHYSVPGITVYNCYSWFWCSAVCGSLMTSLMWVVVDSAQGHLAEEGRGPVNVITGYCY